MLFNSYIFIFLFLPIALLGWYGINKLGKYELAKLFLCLMSLWFYGYFHLSYVFLLLTSLAVNYFLSFLFEKFNNKKDVKGKSTAGNLLILIAGLLFNLGILGYFKYCDFFITNINGIFKTDYALRKIMLPLGISFFTFQQISFIVDRFKKEAPHYSILNYASFITFFPQLIAGPIVLHNELVPQFEDEKRKSFNADSFADGICIFIVGLASKVLLADNLGVIADFSFENIECLDVTTAWLAAITYAFELFLDFAGYSNMAIGIGKMFGIDIPDNFNRPFATGNAKDLWRDWHMTLGRFFRTYVYFPLGGSKKGLIRTLINTMIVFALSGLWHGADWTFVIWGLMHGFAICLNVIWRWSINKYAEKITLFKRRIYKIVCIFINFLFFSFSMVFFRSNNLNDAMALIGRMFSGDHYGYVRVTAMELPFTELYILLKPLKMRLGNNICYVHVFLYFLLLILAAYFSMIKPYRKRLKEIHNNGKWNLKRPGFASAYAILMALIFIWSLVSLSGVSQFLYFNF